MCENAITWTVHELCLCQQSFKTKANEYNDSLKEIRDTVPETTSVQSEIKDVYGRRLDDLNGNYDRLLSLLQLVLESSNDSKAEKKVSDECFGHEEINTETQMCETAKELMAFVCQQSSALLTLKNQLRTFCLKLKFETCKARLFWLVLTAIKKTHWILVMVKSLIVINW